PNFGDFDKTGFRRNVLGQFGRFLKSTFNAYDSSDLHVIHHEANVEANIGDTTIPIVEVDMNEANKDEGDQYKEIRRVRTLNDFELARENTIARNQEALRHLIPDHLRLFPTDDLHTIFSSINVPMPPPNVNVSILRNTEDPVSNDASILSNVRIPMLPSPTPPAPINANSPTLPCLDDSDLSHLSTRFNADALAGAASLLHENHEPITTAFSAGEPVSAHTADDTSPLASAVDSRDAHSMPAVNDVSGDVPVIRPHFYASILSDFTFPSSVSASVSFTSSNLQDSNQISDLCARKVRVIPTKRSKHSEISFPEYLGLFISSMRAMTFASDLAF
ncbi:hypothetical protein PHLCEN_2v10180, partial [Hermanssonia centrifuga]